jgi:hypothetical protein
MHHKMLIHMRKLERIAEKLILAGEVGTLVDES